MPGNEHHSAGNHLEVVWNTVHTHARTLPDLGCGTLVDLEPSRRSRLHARLA